MRRPLALLVVLVAIATSGCFVTRTIRTDDLPRVAEGYEVASGPATTLMIPDGFGNMRTTTVQPFVRSAVTFHAPDGSTFVARGNLDLIVTTVDGDVLRFDAPVSVTDAADHYHLDSPSQTGNLPKARIREAAVRSFSIGRAVAAAIGGTLLGTAVILTPMWLL
jgi:hypothetical protein